MVLQRAPAKAAVYGTVHGPPSSAVSVTVTPQSGAPYVVAAQVKGATNHVKWKAFLKPAPAGGNFTIAAKCTNGCQGNATMSDVTFGDVWTCSGRK